MISLRRMSLGSGYRYLMESVAIGRRGSGSSTSLTDYYAESGTPPGVFLGAGLAALDDGRGVEKGSLVSEEHLFNLLGMCADPVTGQRLGRQPNRAPSLAGQAVAERMQAIRHRHAAERARQMDPDRSRRAGSGRTVPGAGGRLRPDLLPVQVGLCGLGPGRPGTKAAIYACHRRAIEVVLTYAEREVFHSRSGTGGVVQEDIEGVVAAAFTHWDSRAGDPQLHDHVVVANRARSVSDGVWRTLDSRGLFKNVVALSELHQGVLVTC